MKRRFSLNEEDFKQLVFNNGHIVIDGMSIFLDRYEMRELMEGEIVEQSDKLVALQDIGYDRIYNILKSYFKGER